MINYYEELKLDQTLSATELTAELLRLESVWHKREMSRPELAAEKLVQINEAKKVFATDAAKAQYDRELTAVPVPTTPEDPDAARRAQFQKWYQNAVGYFREGQYDLAKTAIERAAGCGANEDDTLFFCEASRIYRNNGELSTAMNYVNRAIVSDPADPENYIEKGFVLEALYRQALQNRGNAADLLRQWRDVLEQAIKRSAAGFYTDGEARARGMLAFSLHFSQPQDDSRAEELARQAVKMGDRWGNAQRVLDDLEEKRAARDKAERDAQARREEAERQAEIRRKQQEAEQKARQQRQAAADAQKRKASALFVLGWLGMIASIGLAVMPILSPERSFSTLILRSLVVFGSIGLLNFAETYKNGYSDYGILLLSLLVGFAYCFICATSAYTLMGYNSSSVAKTWKLFFCLLAVLAAVTFLPKSIGMKANRKSKF